MISLNVYNRQGDSVGTVEVDPAEFGGTINRQLLHDVVVMHLANQRAGPHSTLRRGGGAGSQQRIFRHKGTANARAGSTPRTKRNAPRTPQAPNPRPYEYPLPKTSHR